MTFSVNLKRPDAPPPGPPEPQGVPVSGAAITPEPNGALCMQDKTGKWVPLFHVFAILEENLDFVAACKEMPDMPAGDVDSVIRYIYAMLGGPE